MSTMAAQITSLTIVYSAVYSGADKKKSKLRTTGLCVVTSEFPAQRVSNAENVSIWWRHHGYLLFAVVSTTLPISFTISSLALCQLIW